MSQLHLMSPDATLSLTRPELQMLSEGVRQLIDQAASTRDECLAMGAEDMAAGARDRQRALEQLDERLQAALDALPEA